MRALHWVLKIGNRNESINFFKHTLGMKVLRHEEFETGCKATCNGPYDGRWSKTMIGYGSEDENFVLELTYNYGIGKYTLGNDLQNITIVSPSTSDECIDKTLVSPDGYKFEMRENANVSTACIQRVRVSCSNISGSVDYWHGLLGLKLLSQCDTSACLECQTFILELAHTCQGSTPGDNKSNGRIAFSVKEEDLETLEKRIRDAGHVILTPLVSLDTPGKATVRVCILADPDGHEVCLVGDSAFRELSKFDVNAETCLFNAMKNDQSDEWFLKRGLHKEADPVN